MKEREPYLGVGSTCIDFMVLFQNLRAQKVDPQVVRRRRIEAEISLKFACEICEMQMAIVNHFLHEHPRVRTRGKHPSSRVCGRTCVLQRPVYITACLAVTLPAVRSTRS